MTTLNPALAGPVPPRDTPQAAQREQRLRATAVSLEGAFLAEMLKSAGLDKALAGPETGIGGDQFGSLLVREEADQIARSGGVGIAEGIYRSLAARSQDDQ